MRREQRTEQSGNVQIPGVYRWGEEVQFTYTYAGRDGELLLFEGAAEKPFRRIPLRAKERVGHTGSVCCTLPVGDYTYLYRFGKEERTDPYAREVCYVPVGKTSQRRARLRPFAQAMEEFTCPPLSDLILYKAHVRGLTMQKKGCKAPGTFAGLQEMIPYFTELGITAVLLMPVYEFDHADRNYWGYTTGAYFAPKASYAAGDDPNAEFAMLVDALHAAGIACLTEFYFRPEEDPRFVTDALRHWILSFRLDGVRLAGEGQWTGAVKADPLLATKVLMLPYTEDAVPHGPDPVVRRYGVYNTEYRNTIRRFLKGDPAVTAEAVAGVQQANGVSLSPVNFLADQDGATLADLVMYEERHNEANGEENRDGAVTEFSWNCGVEGPTRKTSVRMLREQQIRNAILLLMTAQGMPLLYAGDECGNSQEGNTNAWCQDNPLGWVDWNKTKATALRTQLVREAIRFRKAHPVLHRDEPLRLVDYRSVGLPDLSCHGRSAWVTEQSPTRASLGMLYCGAYATRPDGTEDATLYLLYNLYWQAQRFALPDLPQTAGWICCADTTRPEVFYPEGEGPVIEEGTRQIEVAPRSIQILIAIPEKA